jgi:hypothetical protein
MLNLTVLEDEFRLATIGRLAACARLEKQESPTPAGNVGM